MILIALISPYAMLLIFGFCKHITAGRSAPDRYVLYKLRLLCRYTIEMHLGIISLSSLHKSLFVLSW
jgi:hypothetical protein